MDRFFKDEASKYIFALLHTDTNLRARLLEINVSLYEDKNKATEWYNKIYNTIKEHPDTNICLLAIEELKFRYINMIQD